MLWILLSVLALQSSCCAVQSEVGGTCEGQVDEFSGLVQVRMTKRESEGLDYGKVAEGAVGIFTGAQDAVTKTGNDREKGIAAAMVGAGALLVAACGPGAPVCLTLGVVSSVFGGILGNAAKTKKKTNKDVIDAVNKQFDKLSKSINMVSQKIDVLSAQVAESFDKLDFKLTEVLRDTTLLRLQPIDDYVQEVFLSTREVRRRMQDALGQGDENSFRIWSETAASLKSKLQFSRPLPQVINDVLSLVLHRFGYAKAVLKAHALINTRLDLFNIMWQGETLTNGVTGTARDYAEDFQTEVGLYMDILNRLGLQDWMRLPISTLRQISSGKVPDWRGSGFLQPRWVQYYDYDIDQSSMRGKVFHLSGTDDTLSTVKKWARDNKWAGIITYNDEATVLGHNRLLSISNLKYQGVGSGKVVYLWDKYYLKGILRDGLPDLVPKPGKTPVGYYKMLMGALLTVGDIYMRSFTPAEPKPHDRAFPFALLGPSVPAGTWQQYRDACQSLDLKVVIFSLGSCPEESQVLGMQKSDYTCILFTDWKNAFRSVSPSERWVDAILDAFDDKNAVFMLFNQGWNSPERRSVVADYSGHFVRDYGNRALCTS